jgi:hypothetical protein
MGNAKVRKLPDLLSLAQQLRGYAGQTDDAHYIRLFLQTAQKLEIRAHSFDSLQTAKPAQHLRG